MSTIVAVFAHPDDESFICGGTLAKFAQDGHRVVLVCATLGEMGRRMGVPPIATRESIAQVRAQELDEAVKALGLHRLVLLGLRDKTLAIQDKEMLQARVLEVLREETPDTVITFHDPLGGHPDHCAIGAAATAAFDLYHTSVQPSSRLFYVAWSADLSVFEACAQPVLDVVSVDIGTVKHKKLAAFRAHKTQSGLNRAIWQSDELALRHLSDTEFFVHTQGPPLTQE